VGSGREAVKSKGLRKHLKEVAAVLLLLLLLPNLQRKELELKEQKLCS
jgi:hypothetical protein